MGVPLLMVSALAMSIGSEGTQPGSTSAGAVVFVCEHGAAKSVVAATLFNEIAAKRGLSIRAVSRGTDPDASVPASIRNGLQAEGMPVNASFTPTRLHPQDVAAASHVVAFDVPITARETVERWDGLPAFSDGYAAASAAIRARVEALVERLTAKTKKVPPGA